MNLVIKDINNFNFDKTYNKEIKILINLIKLNISILSEFIKINMNKENKLVLRVINLKINEISIYIFIIKTGKAINII